jgi:hypothetical protein
MALDCSGVKIAAPSYSRGVPLKSRHRLDAATGAAGRESHRGLFETEPTQSPESFSLCPCRARSPSCRPPEAIKRCARGHSWQRAGRPSAGRRGRPAWSSYISSPTKQRRPYLLCKQLPGPKLPADFLSSALVAPPCLPDVDRNLATGHIQSPVAVTQ